MASNTVIATKKPFINESNLFFNPKMMTHVSLLSSVAGLILAGKNISLAKKDYQFWHLAGIVALGVSAFMIYKGNQEA